MRWGFVGTGRIAERIMPAFRLLPEAQVVAAYSRNAEALNAFCVRWSIDRSYHALDDLVNDPAVDVVYLATPHIVHLEHARRALLAGKPVLCEKPMGMSCEEEQLLVELARERGVFLMEGLWTLFFPVYGWLRKQIASEAMGRLFNAMADFSYHAQYDPSLRFFRRDLGGGAMRGAGIYPLAIAAMVFGGMPEEIVAMADVKQGVDLRSAALMRFRDGGMAQIMTGFLGESVQGLNLAFEKGSIWIPDFWHPECAYVRTGQDVQKIEMPFDQPGFQFEIEEAERCVRNGALESETVPHAFSLGLAKALDEMYRQWEEAKAQD